MTTNQKFLKNAYLSAEKQIGKFYEKNEHNVNTLNDHDLFMMGANYVLQLFNDHARSNDRNEDLKQREDETAEKYQARLRDEIVEAMCSNRGYAYCLRDEDWKNEK